MEKCKKTVFNYLFDGNYSKKELMDFKKNREFFFIKNKHIDIKLFPYVIIDNNKNIIDYVSLGIYNTFKF